jgi:hypothetical protein
MTIDPHQFSVVAKEFAERNRPSADLFEAFGVNRFGTRVIWGQVVDSGIASRDQVERVQIRLRNNTKRRDHKQYQERAKVYIRPEPQPVLPDPDEVWKRTMEGKRFDSLNIKPHTTTRFNAVQRPVATGGGSVLGSIVTGD